MDIKELRRLCAGKTISIVGNAPIKSHRGPEIDSGDMVVRFNKGYLSPMISPSNYGRKTNILSIGSSRRRRISKEDLDFLIDMEAIIWIDSIWPELDQYIPDYIRSDPRTYFYQRSDWEYLFNALGKKKPSSGIMIFDLLHRYEIGSEIKIYGFDWWMTTNKSIHHSGRENIFNPHDGKREKEYITRRILENGRR